MIRPAGNADMANADRIKDLQQFVDDWAAARDRASDRRQQLLNLQAAGVTIVKPSTGDILPTMIEEADLEVRKLHEVYISMNALLDRAKGGEDV